MKILPLQKEDLNFLASAKDNGFIDGYSLDELSRSFESDRLLGFIAKKQNQSIGFIIYTLTDFDADIDSVFVLEDFRQGGVGKELVKAVLDMAIKKRLEKVFLEVRKSNTPAINLYKSQGFIEFSVRKKYYFDGEDAICMKKEF